MKLAAIAVLSLALVVILFTLPVLCGSYIVEQGEIASINFLGLPLDKTSKEWKIISGYFSLAPLSYLL
jgi:hypothetical protein